MTISNFGHTATKIAAWNLAGFNAPYADKIARQVEGRAILDAEVRATGFPRLLNFYHSPFRALGQTLERSAILRAAAISKHLSYGEIVGFFNRGLRLHTDRAMSWR